jgi:hypothetical protein
MSAQSVRVQLTDGHNKWYEQLPVKHRTVDNKWLISTIGMGISTVFDVQESLYIMHKYPNGYEINPIYGKHPNAIRYYSIQAPMTVFISYLSWKWKREDEALECYGYHGHKIMKWHLLNDIVTGIHIVDIGFMTSEGGRL